MNLVRILEYQRTKASVDIYPALVNLHAKTLFNSIQDFYKGGENIIKILERQTIIIGDEIAKVRVKSIAVAESIIVVIMLLSLLLSYLIARNFAGALKHIGTGIEHLIEGELDFDIGFASKDELGTMATNLKILSGRLRERERLRRDLEFSIETLKVAPLKVRGQRVTKRIRDKLADTLRLTGVRKAEEAAKAILDSDFPIEPTELLPLLGDDSGIERLSLMIVLFDVLQLSRVLELSVDKAATAITALEIYDQPESSIRVKKVAIATTINDSLRLYQSWFNGRVRLTVAIPDLPDIWIYPEEMVIIWFNIIKNALQSMSFAGALDMRAELRKKTLSVTISNDGPEIPVDVRSRLFTPFFTTKA